LQQHTFGTDVFQCHCGGRRRVLAIFTFAVLSFHSTDFEMPVSLDNSGTLIPGGVSNAESSAL
jgi:hypothetical protein